MMLTTRQVRTLVQLGLLSAFTLIIVIIADTRYRLLPDALHTTLPSHHTGTVITDITIAYCSTVNPLTKCRLDEDEWQRVEKDLFLGSGWVKSAWLHVKREEEEDLELDAKVVTAVRVSRINPGSSEATKPGEKWESRPGGIWILRSPRRHESDAEKVVTAVDILFGQDAVDPRKNWELSSTPLFIDGAGSSGPAKLSVRHGRPKDVHKDPPVPRINKDGKFKILQISDAHLATGFGTCRDAIGPNGAASTKCEADPRTLEFIESVLDDEKPEMVVLSGDQVEGPAALDTQTAILKLIAPLVERSIPWAAIFGNHDDEGAHSMSRGAQMHLLESLPFSLSQPGPKNVDGTGNYIVEVLAKSPSQHSALTLYMLDTHGLSPDERKYKGYDWIKKSQIEWFRHTADGLKKSHDRYSHIHMDMAFIHIPLPEYAESGNIIGGGQAKEPVTAPGFNSHFFDALRDEGVVAVGCGHDHVNDYCALRPVKGLTVRDLSEVDNSSLSAGSVDKAGVDQADDQAYHSDMTRESNRREHLGPWMCYAGGSGFGGYAGYGGFHRRVRVWEFDTNAGSLTTWKRVECCGADVKEKLDEIVLVENGNVVAL